MILDAAARVRTQLAVLAAAPAADPVPSPCNAVCRVDADSGWCEGCLRTLDEIGAWGALDDAGRRRIWRALGGRAEALLATQATPSAPVGPPPAP